MKIAAAIVAALLLAYLLLLVGLAARSRRAPRLEARNGQLKACDRNSNCVNTQDASRHVAPLAFTGSADEAWQRLRSLLGELPRTRVLAEADGYLRAETATAFFGFRDDVEALLDRHAGVIHLRSASRVGIRDRGVNRARVENIRRRFASRAVPRP